MCLWLLDEDEDEDKPAAAGGASQHQFEGCSWYPKRRYSARKRLRQ